jgi:hypothetical protein
LRSKRDSGIKEVFKKFKKTLDLDKLIKGLKKVLKENENVISNSAEKVRIIKEVSRKDKLEGIYKMIYHGEFERNQALAQIMNDLFYTNENHELYDILERFLANNNYLELKNSIYDFLQNRVPEYRQI